jgi:hypothetical protein
MIAAGLVLVAAGAEAQTMSRGEAQRLVMAASHDLGVSPWHFAGCFREARAAVPAGADASAREQARDAVLLPCLQKANPAITAETLTATIARYRPQPPATGG